MGDVKICVTVGGGEMMCVKSPDPLSDSLYTECTKWSSHSVRVTEEASVRVGEGPSVYGMTSCLCVPPVLPTCLVMLAGISVCRDASTTDYRNKTFQRSQ